LIFDLFSREAKTGTCEFTHVLRKEDQNQDQVKTKLGAEML